MAAIIFPVYVERGCGLAVHQQSVVASVSGKDIEAETKLLAHLRTTCSVGRVALKQWHYPYSYGEYRSLLEEFLPLFWSMRGILKSVPDHKTDKKTVNGLPNC